jgi:hypothetical protein
MPDRHRPPGAAADAPPATVLAVPTVAAWQPDAGDPEVLAWQLPGGELVAAAYSSRDALGRAMPVGQPYVELPLAELEAALAVHGPYRVLVDPTPEDLAAAGRPSAWPAAEEAR